jgi:hypothetical protein
MKRGPKWLGIVTVVATPTAACSSLPIQAVQLGATTLSQGLIAHYRFDEGTGSHAADSSGNRRDGTLTGGTWLADGRFGGALRLDDGEYVSVDPFPDAATRFSVSAWVRITTYTQDTSDLGRWGTIVSTEVGNTGGWEVNVARADPSPALNFGLWKGPNQGDYDSATCACLPLNVWTQVTAVVESDKSELWLYVDGELRGTATVSKGILPGSPVMTIGQWPGSGRYLLGDVDEIAVWSRALVPEEVAELYARPAPDP